MVALHRCGLRTLHDIGRPRRRAARRRSSAAPACRRPPATTPPVFTRRSGTLDLRQDRPRGGRCGGATRRRRFRAGVGCASGRESPPPVVVPGPLSRPAAGGRCGEDAPPERRLAAGRRQCLRWSGPGWRRQKLGKVCGPSTKVDDGLRLAPVHPGGDVDEDHAADQAGPTRQAGELASPVAPPSDIPTTAPAGEPKPLDTPRHRAGPGCPGCRCCRPASSSGRVPAGRRPRGLPGRRASATVSHVRAHRGAVEEHELRRLRSIAGAPHERAGGSRRP